MTSLPFLVPVFLVTPVFCALAGELEARWEFDGVTEREMSHRDGRIVSDYEHMLHASDQRDKLVGEVSGKLVEELHVLTDFLDNVAKRRPKGERKLK